MLAHTGRARWLGLSALLVGMVILLATARDARTSTGGCAPRNTITSEKYKVRICGMPDFDQRRIAGTDLGANRYDVAGLPGDGGCHCVLTSFVNVLGYYATHGLKVNPPAFAWNDRSFTVQNEPGTGGATNKSYDTGQYVPGEEKAYEATTKLIDQLGTLAQVKFGDAGCGTGFGHLKTAATSIASQLSTDVSFSYEGHTVGATSPRDWANAMSMGATVLIAHGRYGNIAVKADGSISTDARGPGHVVTLRSVKGDATTGAVAIRDPNQDEVGETDKRDRVRQSPFSTELAGIRLRFGSFGGKQKQLWQLDDITDGKARFIDEWFAIWPQVFVFLDRAGLSLSGILTNFGPGSFVPLLTTGLVSQRRHYRVGAVADATFVPRTSEVVFALKGSRKVEAIDVATGKRRTVDQGPSAIVDLESDYRRGDVYVLGKRELVRLGLDDGTRLAQPLASDADAVAYDPKTDRVGVVSSKAHSLRLLDAADLAAPAARALPSTLTAGSGRLNLSFDRGGNVVLRREGSASIRRGVVGSRVSARRPIAVKALAMGGGLLATDRGTAVSLVGGKLVEIGATGHPVSRSEFAAIRGSGRLVSLIRGTMDIPEEFLGLTVDQRGEGDPDFPEYGTEPPAGAHWLPTLTDEEADAQFDG